MRLRDVFKAWRGEGILAQTLDEANFERSRPQSLVVEEFLFENRFRALVQVRFVGDTGISIPSWREMISDMVGDATPYEGAR